MYYYIETNNKEKVRSQSYARKTQLRYCCDTINLRIESRNKAYAFAKHILYSEKK